MGRWSEWQPLYHRDGSNLTPSEIPDVGPAAYIIAASRGRSEKHSLYVGSTSDLRTRLYGHSYGDTTTWKALDKLWQNKYQVFYSFHAARTARVAHRLEENTLSEWWLYPLNILGNPTKKSTR